MREPVYEYGEYRPVAYIETDAEIVEEFMVTHYLMVATSLTPCGMDMEELYDPWSSPSTSFDPRVAATSFDLRKVTCAECLGHFPPTSRDPAELERWLDA